MTHAHEVRARLRRLAWLLDSSLRVPGTRFRIGLDAVIGLIPGFGDAAGVLLSSYIVREAWRLGVPKSVLTRMLVNVVIEGVVGAVPLVGDVFDAAWKANQRNVALLESHIERPARTARSSRALVAGLIAAVLLIVAGAAALGWLLIAWLVQLAGA